MPVSQLESLAEAEEEPEEPSPHSTEGEARSARRAVPAGTEDTKKEQRGRKEQVAPESKDGAKRDYHSDTGKTRKDSTWDVSQALTHNAGESLDHLVSAGGKSAMGCSKKLIGISV